MICSLVRFCPMEQNTVIHTILLCFDQGPSVIAQYLLYFETLTALLLSCNCQYHLMWSEHDGACTTVCGWASELIDVLYCNIVHVCIDRTSSSSCVHNILCNHDRTPTLSFHLGVFFFQTVAAILSERMMMFTLPCRPSSFALMEVEEPGRSTLSYRD